MIILIRKRHVAYVVLLCCFVAGLSAVLWHGNAAFTAAFAPGEEGASPVVVVDAGHGGEDGGAVAADGTVESGLNLAIARRVRDLLTFAGVPTTVTREGDAAIYDPGSATLREKKVSDLHNRVALVNELPGAVLLSIHQNSLPSSPSTRGAQVFWNRQEGAEELASSIQEALNGAVNAGHEKKAAQVPSSVYLMKEITAPGVLVECGFLSNAAETEQLKDPAYQTKLAAAIVAGVLNSDKRLKRDQTVCSFLFPWEVAMKPKTLFYCTECGNETPKWAGKCPACGAWNTIVEQPQAARAAGKGASRPAGGGSVRRARPVTELEADAEIRFSTGMGELDRVLGGGAVKGSLVLVGGAPGIGKSTLMLQICESLCRENKVLYVSGEESEHQLKLRAKRLDVQSERLFVISETSLGDLLESVAAEAPDVLIVDSIQTLYNDALESPAGSVSQVKDCTMALMQLAKGQGITVFVIGHVNKEGSIAGPKVLEHMVDCVLYFEGDQHTAYRILRAAKNRFGATNEIGVFEMRDSGLVEVENPSEMLLSGRPEDAPGTCVTCVMEGARPVLAEIQALAVSSPAGNPRRTSNGFDYNRFALLLAVLEKRGGLKVSACDAYLNIIGGLSLDEPAADLAAVIALASSYLDRPVPADLVAIGEVGLTGELRSVSQLGQRVSEVRRLGFTQCLIPSRRTGELAAPAGLRLIPVRNIGEAIRAALRPSE